MTNVVQFPGLGLEFTVNRVAFQIGNFPVYWYGIILALGLLCGLAFVFRYAPEFGIDSDRFVDVACIGTVMAIVCARAYYVIFYPGEFNSLWEILDLRSGGIAMYGSLIGAFLFGGLACKWRKIPVAATFDAVSIGFLIGQGIGRWGNFVNQEAFGVNTDLPWGMYSQATHDYLSANMALLAQEGITVDPTLPVHPTFLYESIWCLLGAMLLFAYMRHRKYNGELAILYCIWNGAGRFWIEGLRTDALMISVELNLRTSQVLAAVMVVAGVAAEAVLLRRFKEREALTVPLPRPLPPKKLGRDFVVECEKDSLLATASHEEFVKATESLTEKLKAAYAAALEEKQAGTAGEGKAPAQAEESQPQQEAQPEKPAQGTAQPEEQAPEGETASPEKTAPQE